MIHAITATNHTGDSVKMELFYPEKCGLIVTSVDGLGPVKSDINVTEVITNDGGVFNSARSSSRNIVLHLRYMETETETIEDIRHKTYKYFPTKKLVKLAIETDTRTLECTGYVETNEANIFSEESGCDISIICPDPYFYTAGLNVTNISDVQPMFEFPFENESVGEPTIVMGIVTDREKHEIIYEGESDVGVSILIHANGDADNITIHNLNTRDQMSIDTDKIRSITGQGISKGDTILINTRKNNKRIVLVRNGVSINILNCLKKNSKWFTLTKGINNFAYTTQSGGSNLEFIVANEIIYDGV